MRHRVEASAARAVGSAARLSRNTHRRARRTKSRTGSSVADVFFCRPHRNGIARQKVRGNPSSSNCKEANLAVDLVYDALIFMVVRPLSCLPTEYFLVTRSNPYESFRSRCHTCRLQRLAISSFYMTCTSVVQAHWKPLAVCSTNVQFHRHY
jgi:hypothetical protein